MPFSIPFSCPPFTMSRFDGKSASFNSFIRNFETYISKRIGPTLRIHYLISACEGEPAESIEHCVLLDPEQGYTEALRILETLYGNPGRISDVSVGRQTKGLPSRRKTITSSVSPPSSDSNKKRMKVRSAHEIRNPNATDIMENRSFAYLNRPADSADINLGASSGNYNYCQLLPTIRERQGRKSPSPSTAYTSRPKVNDSNVKGSKINETSKRHSKSVFTAKLPASSNNQVFPVFYHHHKLRMANNLRAILKWFGRTYRSSRCLEKAENYQYQMKESMYILVVFQLTYSHL